MRFRAIATIESPVAVSARRATGNDLATQPFLPGSTVRGALAAAYLESGTAGDSDFQAMFLRELVRFSDLCKGGAVPWPLSARQCQERDDHPVLDVLLGRAARQFDTDLPIEHECQQMVAGNLCRAKVGLPNGFFSYNAATKQYENVEVGTRRVAHAAVDPDLLRTRGGEFHSSRVIHAGQTFEGFVQASGGGEAALQRFIGEGRTLYVGRGGSRGQGRIVLSLTPEVGDAVQQVAGRIEALNRVAAERFAALQDKIVFTCTLASATILLDEWLLSKPALEATDIAPELEPYKPIAMTRPTDIAGWHAKARLPKADAGALAAGSCFLFHRDAAPGEDRAAAYQSLAQVLVRAGEQGLGERWQEGFGEASFCLPFHYERAEGA